jgi:DNA replication and repair protein RecF
MLIEAVKLTNFRNFEAAELHPHDGVTIFYGDNGAGKTNLLEAIFTLCLGRSQRGARDIMMVREGSDYFRLEGMGRLDGRTVELSCAYQKGGRKRFMLDENPARVSRLYEYFALISMAPEDLSLFVGAPRDRRAFCDLHLSQSSPIYLSDLTSYQKALAQKNAWLKEGRQEACPFDELLIKSGAALMRRRQEYITRLATSAPEYYDTISATKERFAMQYAPNVSFEAPTQIEEVFAEKLAARRERERLMEIALVGPHRDDIEFFIGAFPARGYGSQGELRSAAVAVMMAAADYLEDKREEQPILLLDDIFAELDPGRRDNLARLFDRFTQIFLTTALEPPERLRKKAKTCIVEDGTIREV